jgi:AcrR family transcriptional regulator
MPTLTPDPKRSKRKSGEPTQAGRKANSRGAILKGAKRLFARKGYAAVSVREIAADCELSLPTIYHFFESKESLYQACRLSVLNDAALRLQQALDGTDPRQRVEAATLRLCEMLFTDRVLLAFMQLEIQHRSNATRTRFATWQVLVDYSSLIEAAFPGRRRVAGFDPAESILAFVLGHALIQRAFKAGALPVDTGAVARLAVASLLVT